MYFLQQITSTTPIRGLLHEKQVKTCTRLKKLVDRNGGLPRADAEKFKKAWDEAIQTSIRMHSMCLSDLNKKTKLDQVSLLKVYSIEKLIF